MIDWARAGELLGELVRNNDVFDTTFGAWLSIDSLRLNTFSLH
jgi:hypothetical protein